MAATALQTPANNHNYFLNPPGGGPSPPEAYFYGQAAYPPSPMPHTPPSNNVSPTNYCNMHVRQLRQPRQPLYVPAALRPTELPIPSRPRAPDTPPTSKGNSFDSTNAAMAPPASSALTAQDLGADESPPPFDYIIHEDKLGEVTGPPTTAHWKPDVSAISCAICHVRFTWYFRRHHCRRCGDVVCDANSKMAVPLDQNARFHPKGQQSRACDRCWVDWKTLKLVYAPFHSPTKLQTSSKAAAGADEAEGADADSAAQSPAVAVPNLNTRAVAGEQRVGSMAYSEQGMIWSTF